MPRNAYRRGLIGSRGLLLGLVIALAAVLACKEKPGTGGATGTAAAPSGDFVIGAYLSMTGSKADFGINTQRGAQMAIEELNAQGGIKGRKIALKVLDDQG